MVPRKSIIATSLLCGDTFGLFVSFSKKIKQNPRTFFLICCKLLPQPHLENKSGKIQLRKKCWRVSGLGACGLWINQTALETALIRLISNLLQIEVGVCSHQRYERELTRPTGYYSRHFPGFLQLLLHADPSGSVQTSRRFVGASSWVHGFSWCQWRPVDTSPS